MARMYPSSSSIHPFLHIPQSFHLSPQFLPHIETSNNFLSHYQQDMLANHLLSSDFPSGFENLSKATATNQQTNDTALNEEVIRNLENFVIPKKRSRRTDRHSKIYTAGGLRDRRVRLSIEIARKFFKLQDMLGFDKASKTIGWLLNHSKSSITELELKHGCNGGAKKLSSFSGLCDQVEVGKKVKESTCVMGKDKKVNKQSRTRARARARERTREKMIITCTKEIDDTTEVVNDLNPPISNRCTSLMSEKLINGSILYSRFENCDLMKMLLKPSPISNDQLNFPKDFIIPNVHKEYSVISKYWEACNNDGRC